VPQRIANIADNRASFIDLATAASKRQAGWRGSDAICKRGETIGQSCFSDECFSNLCDVRQIGDGSYVGRGLQTVADPDTAGAADLYPAGCGPSALASRGACLKPTWWPAVSEKKSFYTEDTSDMSLAPESGQAVDRPRP
jgi:hypothetical protein